MFYKKGVLNVLQISQEKPVLKSNFNEVYYKETLTQVFVGEIFQNAKNTYFQEHL